MSFKYAFQDGDVPNHSVSRSRPRSIVVSVSKDHASTSSEFSHDQGQRASSTPLFSNSSRQSTPRPPSIDRSTFANTFRSSSNPFSPISEPRSDPDIIPSIKINYSQDDDAYAKLLGQVIDGARRKAGNFPPKERGTFDMDELREALSGNSDESSTIEMPFGKMSDGQMAHDQKIGAAGELYVSNSWLEFIIWLIIPKITSGI